MKRPIMIFLFLFNCILGAQNTSIEKICVNNYFDFPENTYFSDIDNTFDPFVGTWKWTDGSQVLIIQLTKVSNYYVANDKLYKDFMVGDYKFSQDGGISFTTNTIVTPFNVNPDLHPMYGLCVEDDKLDFIFRDVAYNKKGCRAVFENLHTSPQTLRMILKNPQELMPRFEGQPPIPAGFSIPSDVILTKQN